MNLDPKMPVDQIDRRIEEFRTLAERPVRANARQFYGRGADLAQIRDNLSVRLENGWTLSNDNAKHADLWFELLERYERINDILNDYADESLRESAASIIFDGVPHGQTG